MLLFDENTTLGVSWNLFCMATIHDGFFFNSILYHRSVVFSGRFLCVQCIGINAVEKCVVSVICAALYFVMLHQFKIMFSKSYGSFVFSGAVFSSPKKQI